MRLVRLLSAITLLLMAAALPAASQSQPHWLIGTWKGSMGNVAINSRFGSDRSLVVSKVSADGTSAKGKWTGEGNGLTVTMSISGNDISFQTPGSLGNSYKLTRKNDVLEGSWQRSGDAKSGPISLKKQ